MSKYLWPLFFGLVSGVCFFLAPDSIKAILFAYLVFVFVLLARFLQRQEINIQLQLNAIKHRLEPLETFRTTQGEDNANFKNRLVIVEKYKAEQEAEVANFMAGVEALRIPAKSEAMDSDARTTPVGSLAEQLDEPLQVTDSDLAPETEQDPDTQD